jgi:hypothetical protein
MTGKVLDNGASRALVFILPIAVAVVVLMKAWPVLLLLMVLTLATRIWQQYQWQQWCKLVNPLFNELIKENKGCLTPMDLSLKANLTAKSAKVFLEKKAEEYGAQKKSYQDRGTIYYFLTASALGSIFDESEPALESENEEIATKQNNPPAKASSVSVIASLVELENNSTTTTETANILGEEKAKTVTNPSGQKLSPDVTTTQETKETQEESNNPDTSARTDESAGDSLDSNNLILNQGDLAKRLDVHQNTIGKRKSDPDFSQWSQSKDPEGVAWKYSAKTKMFVQDKQ